jgi:hypothetical protein
MVPLSTDALRHPVGIWTVYFTGDDHGAARSRPLAGPQANEASPWLEDHDDASDDDRRGDGLTWRAKKVRTRSSDAYTNTDRRVIRLNGMPSSP